ncbi:MAG: hypothetical protein IKZ12_04170 [Alistipes sp.]|nr:hypothetical protein [Alistipes sp.]
MKKLLLSFCALCAVAVCFADGDTTTSETTKDVVITFDPESTDQEFRDVVFNISGCCRNGVIYLEIQPMSSVVFVSIFHEKQTAICSNFFPVCSGVCTINIGDLNIGEYDITIGIDDSVYAGVFYL